MYQIIEMYGDYEPWWFLEDWEKDIVTSQSFDDYYEALKYYKRQWLLLREQSPLFKSRSDLMTIFGILRISAGVKSVRNTCNNIIQSPC